MYKIIRNYLSADECDDYIAMTRVLDPNPSLEVGLKTTKKSHHHVNRTYWTLRSMTKHFRPLKAQAEKYWDLPSGALKFTHAPKNYAHIMCYDAPGQGLEWHAEPNISTVSVSINLSNPWEYEGADFELRKAPSLELFRGDAIFYSSTMVHRVADLVSGRKLSFVMWLK